MAGNIAEAIKNNSAFIPWIQDQYRAGSEIAGLCTSAFFIADTGLIQEKHSSSHWFVDATFRKQYSQINSLAEKAGVAAGSVHSDAGAWFFLQKLVERVAGKKAASACSAAFQGPFDRECQSIVSVSDPRRKHSNRIAKRERVPAGGQSMQETTVQRFISRFDVNRGDREDSLSIATVFEESLQTPGGNTNPKAFRASAECEGQGRVDNHNTHHNTRIFKALFNKLERLEKTYGDV
jgi:hypothetical protein